MPQSPQARRDRPLRLLMRHGHTTHHDLGGRWEAVNAALVDAEVARRTAALDMDEAGLGQELQVVGDGRLADVYSPATISPTGIGRRSLANRFRIHDPRRVGQAAEPARICRRR